MSQILARQLTQEQYETLRPTWDVPLISILMPCHNHEQYVGQAIHSVLEQDYPNWELCIVDDASTDTSFEIITSNFHDARIKAIRLQENKGEAGAMNHALNLMDPDSVFVTRLDSDDFLSKDKLSQCFNYIATAKCKALFTDMATVDDYGEVKEKFSLKYFNPLDIPQFCNIPTATMFVDRGVFNELRYDESLKVASDYDMLLKIYKLTSASIHYLPMVTYYRRLHQNNASYKTYEYEHANEILNKKHRFKQTDVLFVAKFDKDITTGIDTSVLAKRQVLLDNNISASIHEHSTYSLNQLISRIENTKPKVVFFEGISATMGEVFELVNKFPAVQFIYTLHSQFEYLLHQNLLGFVNNLSNINAQNFLLTFSHLETARYFNKVHAQFFAEYVPNPLACEIKTKKSKKKDEKKLVVTLFGSLNPYKNIYTQIQAINLLAQDYDKTDLYITAREEVLSLEEDLAQIMSEAEYATYLHVKNYIASKDTDLLNKVSQMLSNKINLVNLGNVQNDEIRRVIDTADIGFQVSQSESFGYLKYEHLARKVSVVTAEDCNYADFMSIYETAKTMLSKQAPLITTFVGKCNKEYVKYVKRFL